MPNPVIRWLLLLALAVLVFVIICKPPTLPIYQLAPPSVSTTAAPALVASLLGPGATASETADRVFFRAGARRVEIFKNSGGIWFEDSTQLWNPNLTPQLPPDSSLLRSAAAAVSPSWTPGGNPFSRDSAFTRFEFERILPTFVTTRNHLGTVSTVKLDLQVGYGARVADRPGARRFPVTGGGGEFKIHYGDQGSVIGFHGVWREIQRVARRERVVRRPDADREYLQQVGGGGPVVFPPPRIAYYSEPAPFAQDELYPVYVYAGKEVVGGDSIPLRVVLIPATRGGSRAEPPPGPMPHPLRTPASQPRPGSTDPEGPEEGGNGPAATQGNPWREVGAYWIGGRGGVPGAEANARGLLDSLRADGWAVNFNWGNSDAWYDDWNANRSQWVDAADLVFYTGHADAVRWKLWNHAKSQYKVFTSIDVASVNGGMFGAGDLEWIIIAACGPLQDDKVSPGGLSAIDRWSGAFGGLHLLLGYASASLDRPKEGSQFAKYALEGNTIVYSWLRAATELQPITNDRPPPDGPNIYAGAMWAEKSGKPSPFFDHLWGHGFVAPDPVPRDSCRILFSP